MLGLGRQRDSRGALWHSAPTGRLVLSFQRI